MTESRTKIVYASSDEKFMQGLADGTIDTGDLVVMPEKFIYITSTGEMIESTPNKLIELLQENLNQLTDKVEQSTVIWTDYTQEVDT